MKSKKRPSPSATDLSHISAHLPSAIEEQRKREEYAQLFSTTTRAGAGGTKAGLVGLRPMGKRGMDFVDAITPKREKRKNSYDEMLPEEPKNGHRRPVDGHVKYMLPRTFCPDCGRTDRPKVGGAINMNMYKEGRPEWNMGPMDIMLSFFCDSCYELQLRSRNDRGNDVMLAQVGGISSKGDYDSATRLVRIKANTEAYMAAHKHDEEIRVKR